MVRRRLHSIPPANRRKRASLDSISSLRASIKTGFFQIGSAQRQSVPLEESYQPKAVKANPAAQKLRASLRETIETRRMVEGDELKQLFEEFPVEAFAPWLLKWARENSLIKGE